MKIIFLTVLLFCTQLSYTQNTSSIELANQYYNQAEYDKARPIFDQLSSNKLNYQLIFINYLDLLKKQNDLKTAEKFLVNANKFFSGNIQYQASLASLYNYANREKDLLNYLGKLKNNFGSNPFHIGLLAQQFYNEQLYTQSIDFFRYSRTLRKDSSVHALELASLFRLIDEKENMLNEYLNYANTSANRLSYVKNLLQNYLQEDSQLNELESILIKKIQSDPENMMYPELMIWLELQRKNFQGAFIQSKALDNRLGNNGDKSLEIGRIAMENLEYDQAALIFNHVASRYTNSKNFSKSKTLYLQAKELQLKNEYPINQLEIRNLAVDYQNLYEIIGSNPSGFKLIRSKALLHAFYLNEIDSGRFILEKLVQDNRAGRMTIAESKLDLGDIFILLDEPWEATLLYSQVEKSFKSHPIGYKAKLKNAKLNYYTGNFSVAKNHLDILKRNTTRQISNDAIALSVLITDNTALDTTDLVMKKFAKAELLLFQNENDSAKSIFLDLLQDYEFHSVSDEIYWRLAQISLEEGRYQESISNLDFILTDYAYDILADDAAFKKAEIFDLYIDKLIAKDLYQKFLIQYPGSKYVVNARKRFRQLRGDFIN